jgi:hypothetical protein
MHTALLEVTRILDRDDSEGLQLLRVWILRTNYLNLSPWERKGISVCQEIPRPLWNSKLHYHVHKGPPLIPFQKQVNPVHNSTSYFIKIRFKLFSRLLIGNTKIVFRISVKNLEWMFPVSRACYVPYPSHLDHSNNTGWGLQVMKLFHYAVSSSRLLGPDLPSNLFSNILRWESYVNKHVHARQFKL